MNYNYKYDSIVFITNQGDKYYVNQLCDMFCVTPETIMKWMDNGELGNKIYEKKMKGEIYEFKFSRISRHSNVYSYCMLFSALSLLDNKRCR